MAYVLVAVGALMAAAGLYVIGYGWIDARYEEYWNALGAGAALTAGGTITLALGFVVRALLQVKAAFVAQPASIAMADTAMDGPSAKPIAPERSEAESVIPEPLAAASAEADHAPAEPSGQLELPVPRVASGRHPLRPPPAVLQEPASIGSAQTADLEPRSEPAVELFGDETRDLQPIEPSPDDVSAARPADDYKLETPSTPEHDLPPPEPAISEEKSPVSLPRSSDWFDRALADIDEELPLVSPAIREPLAPTTLPPKPAAEPSDEHLLEPAMVGAEPIPSETARERPAASSPAPTVSGAAVIGRYEAEGTSYVMYADGSIEAQSSAGVYRFGSMAELKAFIES